MPDMFFDVDVAITECPVNIFPLTDDTDFKTRETAIVYNQAGMDLVWNFVTSAGVFTQTAVTPTTAGVYDWVNQGDGMYSIEIPASGGASINNDTEGYGWFTGICTGVLAWRGPVIGFRAAGLNDLLIDNAYSTTRGLAGTALPAAAADAAGGLIISDLGGQDVDAAFISANRLTAARAQIIDDWANTGRLDTILDTINTATAGLGGAAMRGTDNAALASVVGTLADVAAAGDPTAVDTLMQYMKQLVNVLVGTVGVTTFPAGAAAANNVSLAEVIRALETHMTELKGSTFNAATDSNEAIRDRGDVAWITGGGAGLTDILNISILMPPSIDLANTATFRLGMLLINSLDDLPSTAEITPGTISIERKAIGGTSWSAVVTDAACSELAGLIYYDEVFNTGSGYAEGDSIRVTFKSQKITVAANDYEISDANGRMFFTSIRQTMRGTDNAALASVATESRLAELDAANIPTDLADILAALANIVSVGAATNVPAESYLLTTGVQSSGLFTDTAPLDGTRHEHTDTAGALDLYYQHDIGIHGVPTGVTLTGYITSANDSVGIYAYNWGTTSWDQIGTLNGGPASDSTYTYALYTSHVGTGANLGKVRIRLFQAAGLTTATLAIDQLFVSYATIPEIGHVDGTITDVTPAANNFDTNLTQADGFWDDALLTFRSGALEGQSRPITTSLLAGGNLAFDESFTIVPANGDEFTIEFSHIHPISQIRDSILTDSTPFAGASIATIAANAAAILLATQAPKKNTAFPNLPVFMVLTADHVTPAPGLTLAVTRSIDGGAFSAATGTAAEIGNGVYQFDASAADMNGDVIVFRFAAATADDSMVSIHTRP